MDKYAHTRNDGKDEDEEYRNILRELGIEKPKGEPITKEEFRHIFMYAQDVIGMGS